MKEKSMSKKPGHESRHSGCCPIAFERNRYFTGKYMAARDFLGEQEYFLSRHRLHNRVLHGWGVVCGLRVVPHPDKDCSKRWVVVKPGIALDCCGRELVLEAEKPHKLPFPEPKVAPPPTAAAAPAAEGLDKPNPAYQQNPPPKPPQEKPIEFLVCITYHEELIEKVPALYNEGACDPSRNEANRVREVAKIVVLDPEEYPKCWRTRVSDPEEHCCDDCDQVPGPVGICLEPDCPCGDAVPLALVRYQPGDPENLLQIEMEGRRTLRMPPEFLTHIVSTNWPHGGTITLSDLRVRMKGRLEVYFDRKIKPTHGDATGINQFTFVVGYSDIQRSVEFLPIRHKHPPTLDSDCRAVYSIAEEILSDEYEGLTLSNHIVYVTLNCDFILDCHDNAVDGNFLGARFPTGNGLPGSTFRSWFRVRDRR
jgi:hypothetical protein